METGIAERILDHRTRPVDLFGYQKYNLRELDCARVPNRSFGSRPQSRIEQNEFAGAIWLTLSQSILPVRGHKLGP